MRVISLITLLVSLLLCGCASFPKRSTGRFNAQNGDFIVIKKDGALYWSPSGKTTDRLTFVGMAMLDKSDTKEFRLIVPSASQFLNASIKFSPNFSHVTVDWGTHARDAASDRSAEFDRQGRK